MKRCGAAPEISGAAPEIWGLILLFFSLCQKLLDAHEEQNVDAYTDAVRPTSPIFFPYPPPNSSPHPGFSPLPPHPPHLAPHPPHVSLKVKEYDSITRLDQWLTTMLLRIKKTIQGEEEDLR